MLGNKAFKHPCNINLFYYIPCRVLHALKTYYSVTALFCKFNQILVTVLRCTCVYHNWNAYLVQSFRTFQRLPGWHGWKYFHNYHITKMSTLARKFKQKALKRWPYPSFLLNRMIFVVAWISFAEWDVGGLDDIHDHKNHCRLRARLRIKLVGLHHYPILPRVR